jgi:hypothetical protein
VTPSPLLLRIFFNRLKLGFIDELVNTRKPRAIARCFLFLTLLTV